MAFSAPINELKRKAKLLGRKEGIPHNQALDKIAREEGYPKWGLLIREYEKQKSRPTSGGVIENLPFDEDYRKEAIELANATFERVIRRIEPDNPKTTRELWDAAEYIDNHHLSADMLPIDREYALSLIEAFLVHYVIDLAVKADNKSAA